MQTRLLAFLADTEAFIRSERPTPVDGGTWETSRSVNYTLGIARLNLGYRTEDGQKATAGSILLQSFRLADGTVCLKSTVSWMPGQESVHPIFAKPDLNWRAEAGLLANLWVAGPTAKGSSSEEEPALLAAG